MSRRTTLSRRWVASTAALVATALTAGACAGPAARSARAKDAATTFARAVTARDFAGACGVLVQATAEQLQQQGGSCPAGLAAAGLDDAGEVSSAQVWGRAALVTFSGGQVFLADVAGRWLVTAAGCTRREQSPADCAVGTG